MLGPYLDDIARLRGEALIAQQLAGAERRARLMNGRQRVVMLIGLSVLALMLLFPPWSRTSYWPVNFEKESLGYHLIFSPPTTSVLPRLLPGRPEPPQP